MSDEPKASSPVQQQPESQNIKANPDKKDADTPPVAPPNKNLIGAPPNNHSEHTKAATHQKNLLTWERFERAVKIIECAALVSAVPTAIFIGYQWSEMRKAGEDTKRIVEFSRQQLEEMKEARTIDERAWVAPISLTNKIHEGIEGMNIIVECKNTGKTPALNVSDIIGAEFNIGAIPQIESIVPTNSAMIAPDGVFKMILPIPDSTAFAISNGATLYVHGRINYDDIFGNHHWTRFCWFVEGGFKVVGQASAYNSCDDPKQNGTE